MGGFGSLARGPFGGRGGGGGVVPCLYFLAWFLACLFWAWFLACPFWPGSLLPYWSLLAWFLTGPLGLVSCWSFLAWLLACPFWHCSGLSFLAWLRFVLFGMVACLLPSSQMFASLFKRRGVSGEVLAGTEMQGGAGGLSAVSVNSCERSLGSEVFHWCHCNMREMSARVSVAKVLHWCHCNVREMSARVTVA